MYTNIDDELAFAMASKMNVSKCEWTKLIERKKQVENFLYHGRGDLNTIYKDCLSANEQYLRLVQFDECDSSEYLIKEFLKRSVASGLLATKCLEYSLRAYEIVVATIGEDGGGGNDDDDAMEI
jgi:hypothetical protein